MDNLAMIQIEDTIIHKQYVLGSALKIFHYLCSVNKDDLGIELLKRAAVHDNSKLEDKELYLLSRLNDRIEAFTDPDYRLNDTQKEIIEEHWRKNRHHPEYFEDYNEMTELDILEMCCDWSARSSQYGTDLMEFVKTRQENRFHFSPEVYKKVVKYCKILAK